MIYLKLNENDSFELLLKKFKRLFEKSGILSEIKKHKFFEKPSVVKKKSKTAAIRRLKALLEKEKKED